MNSSSSNNAASMDSMSIDPSKAKAMKAEATPERALWVEVLLKCLYLCGVVFMLYMFLVGLDLLGGGLQVLAGDSAGSLFHSIDNPVAGLAVGVLATCLVQSSSTTTSIVVALVGAGVMGVEQSVYLIFGANIGTSVTNTFVVLTFMGNRAEYGRAFAAATVHDAFNIMNVALWFPVEWISDALNNHEGGVLTIMTAAMVEGFEECDDDTESCEKWESPIKTWTKAISTKVIEVNKNVLKDYATGEPRVELCADTFCAEGDCMPHKFFDKRCSESALAVNGTVCDGTNAKTKAQFDYCASSTEVFQDVLDAALVHYDEGESCKGGVFYPDQVDQAGLYTFLIALFMLFAALFLLVKLLGLLISGRAEKIVQSALAMNGYLAILVGTGITMLFQSSSITTSTLTPLAAIEAVTLEGVLPLTLGANIGTTFTAVLASMVSDSVEGVQIALVHVMFNVFGVVLFYPIRRIRNIPLGAARRLGEIAYVSKPFPVLYILTLFFATPAILLGLSLGYTLGGTGAIVGTSIALVIILAALGYFAFWYRKRDGKLKIAQWMERRYGAIHGTAAAETSGDKIEDVEQMPGSSASDSSDDTTPDAQASPSTLAQA